MATQDKEDVFQNVKFTAVKSNTRKESDVEFQDSENDPSSNRSTDNNQDNEHTQSKFLNVLQRKGVWIGLIAVTLVTLVSTTTIGVVYSHLDSRIARLEACTSLGVSFTATLKGAKTFIKARHIKYDNLINNEGGDYHISTGNFVCSTPGTYSFHLHAESNKGTDACLQIQVNGDPLTSLLTNSGATSTGATVHLQQGDVVRVMRWCDSDFFRQYIEALDRNPPTVYLPNMFTGYLLKADQCSA